MAGRLQRELKQSKPFASREAEAALNILRTADSLTRELDRTLKEHGLTSTQYNLLRILRGAGEAGATCSQIAERMIHRDPDITRLLERMEKRGLIRRARDRGDRRVVAATITPAGQALADQLDAPLAALNARLFQSLTPEQLEACVEMMETIRSGEGGG